jgi:hypothetical protein
MAPFDVPKPKPIARVGCYDYTTVDNVFRMAIPGDNRTLLAGLEGSQDKRQRREAETCVRTPAAAPHHFGGRLSMNACTPSSAASSIMLHAMVAAASP